MTGHEEYVLRKAREELAAVERLDMSDDRAMARAIGRLEVALSQMIDIVEGADGPQSG